jgi:hypothetical protein
VAGSARVATPTMRALHKAADLGMTRAASSPRLTWNLREAVFPHVLASKQA